MNSVSKSCALPKREIERGSLSQFTLDPDPPAVHFDDALHDGQSHPRAIDLRIEFVEQAKDALVMFGRNADAVVPDVYDWHALFFCTSPNLDEWFCLLPCELERIVQQVLDDFLQTLGIPEHDRQVSLDLDLGVRAKERSRHNTFMVVPLVLIMLSSHFPTITFGHRHAWAMLGALTLVGWAVAWLYRKH